MDTDRLQYLADELGLKNAQGMPFDVETEGELLRSEIDKRAKRHLVALAQHPPEGPR